MDFRNNLYFQKLWSGCWEEESSVLQESPVWAAILYLRYKSSMTCLLSCSVWAFTPTTFMACKYRGGETISLCVIIVASSDVTCEAIARSEATGLPCPLCWPWWSWGSAGECWRPWWQEQWFPPAASPDTGRWTARPAGWSTWEIAFLHFINGLLGSLSSKTDSFYFTVRAAGQGKKQIKIK